MSVCISLNGEYSEHLLSGSGDDRFICDRCYGLAEDELFDALRAAEAERDAALAEVERLESEREQQAEWGNADDWLRDQHARYHDQPGNMLGRNECGEERCDFWSAAAWVLNAPSGARDRAVAEARLDLADAETDRHHFRGVAAKAEAKLAAVRKACSGVYPAAAAGPLASSILSILDGDRG